MRLNLHGLCCCVTVLFFIGIGPKADAQLRIVSYNTLQGPNTGFDIVAEAMGEESYSGFSKPVDVFLLQEQNNLVSSSGSTQQIVNVLNGIYGPGVYTQGTTSGSSSSDIRQGIIYNTTTVSLIDEIAFGSLANGAQERQTLRYQLRPVGYDSAADFYAYNNHYKASSGNPDQAQRLVEAMALRDNADALGEGVPIIYAGDYNMRSSSEDAFQELISAGPGQAEDPINQTGNWHNNPSYAEWHTQSPRSNFGGIDDRFDFQLVTGELLDNEGLSYIPGSYHTFGNNGSTYNTAINNGNTINFSGITSFSKSQVLNALESASDHLPVVADYQLPAVLEAMTGTIPAMLNQGQAFDLNLLVRNAADVLFAGGADELDYSFTTTGDLFGSGSGIETALAAGDTHFVTLDTSSEGAKSGSIIVSSTSQGAANSLVNIPITFQVGEGTPTVEQVIARAVFPTVSGAMGDLNVTSFQFGGDFTTEDTDINNGGTLPVGSDARSLAFTSDEDVFGIKDRDDGLPFAIRDDSTSTADSLGILRSTDFDNTFLVSDSVNGDNANPLTAEWIFDISSAIGAVTLSIDIAAMGDFEASNDTFSFETSIDGSPFTNTFVVSVNEDGTQTYMLEDGSEVMLDDPLVVNEVTLDNLFQTFTSQLAGVGDELTLRFTGSSNGSSEAFAFRNVTIEGLVNVGALAGDYNGDGTVNLADYTVWRDSLGATVDAGTGADGDGNSMVDAGDYAIWKNNFGQTTNLLSSQIQLVPEPQSAWLVILPLACALAISRKNTATA